MKKCENCGFDKNQDKQKFCMKCGKPLDAAVNKELADEAVKEESPAPSQQKAVKLEKTEAENTSGLSPIPEFDFESKSISASVSKAKKAVGDTASEAKKGYQKHKTLINIIICIIAAIIILAIIIPAVVSKIKESNYQNQLKDSYGHAVSLFDSENYAEASEIFVTLGDYEDSKNLALESVYQNGLKLAEEKKYSEAAAEFDKNISYKDSYTLSVKYEKYAEAYQFVENGDYSNAKKAFVKLGDEEMVTEIKYAEAVDAMNDGEYLSALSEFKKISGYKDSDEKYKECAYAYATEQYDLGKYKNAEYYFEMLGDYKDSQEKFKITSELADEESENNKLYKEASDLLGYNRYLEAAEIYKSLGDYKDSAEKAKEAENLYQDSLPEVIDGPASTEKQVFKFDGGEISVDNKRYFRYVDGSDFVDNYKCFDNINLTLYDYPSNEQAIENELSKYITLPDENNATFYGESPFDFLNSASGMGVFVSHYEYSIDSYAQVKNYLFITIREYINYDGGNGYIPTDATHIFDITTGEKVKLRDIANMDLLEAYAIEYAIDSVYKDISYDTYTNDSGWENRIRATDWYSENEWGVNDTYFSVLFTNIFSHGARYEWNVGANIPIDFFESCLY